MSTTMTWMPSAEAVKKAHTDISPYIHQTPIHRSTSIDDMMGCALFLKCDNFQKGGSYKIRGATFAVQQLNAEERAKGVATHSSGNFAQALALAARSFRMPAYIVMPENAPKVKIDAVQGYGGKVILCPSTLADRERTLQEVIENTGATPIHPSNQRDVILGQSTMTQELLSQVPKLDYVITPIGGGGVGAGACLACHYFAPETKVIGAEPEQADDAFRSLQQGRIMPAIHTDTIADGLRTQLGDQNFPIIQSLIDRIILVSEADIISAMRLIWERMKLIIEPSSATPLAAILTDKKVFKNKRVGLINTGGNVSLDKLPYR